MSVPGSNGRTHSEHRSTPQADVRVAHRHVCYGPQAEMAKERSRATPDDRLSKVAIPPASIARWQRDVDAFLRKLLPDPLELLIVRDRDRTGIAEALEFPRRVIDVGLHDLF